MSSVDPKILGKIKKCLALASSSNPNEAATALRQAHALMERHGVSTHHITVADIGESRVDSKTMSRDKPAQWETRLASLVGRSFGCQILVCRTVFEKKYANQGQYAFVGLKQQAEVAAYTASVLIRKCKSARQQWLTENYGGASRGYVGVKARLTRMGDMFAEGWVSAIGKLVVDFANPPEVTDAIKQILEQQTTGQAETRAVSKNAIGALEHKAAMSGMEAARGESLYRPMQTDDAPLSLGYSGKGST